MIRDRGYPEICVLNLDAHPLLFLSLFLLVTAFLIPLQSWMTKSKIKTLGIRLTIQDLGQQIKMKINRLRDIKMD